MTKLGLLMAYCWSSSRPPKNGHIFADDLCTCIFLNENIWISTYILLKFVHKGQINNIPSFVQMVTWHRPGGKPLSEHKMFSLLGLNESSTVMRPCRKLQGYFSIVFFIRADTRMYRYRVLISFVNWVWLSVMKIIWKNNVTIGNLLDFFYWTGPPDSEPSNKLDMPGRLFHLVSYCK